MFEFIWSWLIAHAPGALSIVTGVKLIAETVDSVKKLAPDKLEVKEVAQTYMTETLTIAKDQSKDLEERRLELDTRSEITESMVRFTAIEAAYNILRFAVFASFTAFLFRQLVRILTMPKRPQPPVPTNNM